MPRPHDDAPSDLQFPERGLWLAERFDEQPEHTTPSASNVRLSDPLAGRDRGGSRPGLARYIDQQVNGANPIQHLTSIVTVTGEALPWVFGDQFFGVEGLDPFDSGPDSYANVAEGPAGGGGGGYQPSGSFQEKRPQVRVDTSTPSWPADGSTTNITATVTDHRGNRLSNQNVAIATDPPGANVVGDGITDGDGLAGFNVWSTEPATVVYQGSVTEGGQTIVTGSDTATITFGGFAFVQANQGSFQNPTPAVVTLPVEVTEGNLLVICLSNNNQNDPASITDSRGNAYTKAGSSSFGNERCSIWWALAGDSGVLTVEPGVPTTGNVVLAVLEYAGVNQADPFDAVVTTGTDTGPGTVEAGPISPAGPGRLAIALFNDLSDVPGDSYAFTPAALWALRSSTSQIGHSVSCFVVDQLSAVEPTTTASGELISNLDGLGGFSAPIIATFNPA